MAKKVKKQFVVDLTMNTKDAEKQLKATAEHMKTVLADMGKASDKMGYFKELVDYIKQIDTAMDALKNKDPIKFNDLFGGLDENLKQMLESLFDTSGADISGIETIKKTIAELANSSSAGVDDLRKVAKEINGLYQLLGKEAPIDIDTYFKGKGNKEDRIKMLSNALADFATVWDSVNEKVKQGFSFGGTGNGGGFSGTGSPKNTISKLTKNAQQEIDKLEAEVGRIKSLKDDWIQAVKDLEKIDNGESVELQYETTEESAKELLNTIKELSGVREKYEKGQLTSEEDYRNLIKYINAVSQLVELSGREQMENSPTINQNQDFIDDLGMYASDFFEKSGKKLLDGFSSQLSRIIADAQNKIKLIKNDPKNFDMSDVGGDGGKTYTLTTAYDELNEKLEEYIELQKQLSAAADLNDDGETSRQVEEKIIALEETIYALDKVGDKRKELEAIVEAFSFEDINKNQALEQFCDILGIQIPQNIQTTESAITSGTNSIGQHLVNTTEYIRNMTLALKEMHAAAGRSADFEYHIAMDGLDIKARHGSEKSVDVATQTESYLDYLFSDSVLYGHSHRGGTSTTNISDITSVLSTYKDGVSIPVHFVVGKDAITTIDFTGISQDMVDQLLQEINATGLSQTAPVSNDIINKIAKKFTGKDNALKTWNIDQFGDLAKYLHDISSAATSALTPIEKFQAILNNIFGNGKVDASKYESLLSGLNKDNAKSIFNQIASMEKLQPIKTTDMLTMGQVNAEIDESIAKYRTLREEANLSYSDIRNEVDKVIEHYKSGGGVTSGLSFFQQYFPEGEWQHFRELLTNAYDNLISIEEVTNRIADEFGIDPETFAQIPTGTNVDDLNKNQIEHAKTKLQEFRDLADEINSKRFWSSEENVEIGKYTERLDLAKQTLDALGQQGLITSDELKEVQEVFDAAKTHLDESTSHYSGYGSGYYWDSYEDEYKEAQEQNKQLQEENEVLREQLSQQLHNQGDLVDGDYDEEFSDIQRENGALEDKLQILEEIANAYGMQISQKDRNRYEELNDKDMESGLTDREVDRFSELSDKIDEADSNLLEFEETYERIVVTLANGKKLEILPNDKGLRDLYTIADEYGATYKGVDIENVEFVRQEQFLKTQIDSYEELCELVVRYNELINKQRSSKEEAELNSLLERIRATEHVKFSQEELLDPGRLVQLGYVFDGIGGLVNQDKLARYLKIEIPQAAQQAENALNNVHQEQQELFSTSSGQITLFDGIADDVTRVDAEVEELKNDLKEIAVLDGQISLDDHMQSVPIQVSDPDATINEQTNAFKQEGQIVDQVTDKEMAALQQLVERLQEVKDAVQVKTQAFQEEEGIVVSSVEAELTALQKLLDKLLEIENIVNVVATNFGAINGVIDHLNLIQGIDAQKMLDVNDIPSTEQKVTNNDYALDTTLLATNNILESILAAINNNESVTKLINPLNNAVLKLEKAASGIAEHQKAQKTNLIPASTRIANNYGQLSSISGTAVAGIGDEFKVKQMKALSDGIVRVEGAVKNVDGVWKGFVVDINESNEAVVRAVNEQSEFAHALNESAQAAKQTKKDVDALAQFKQSGRFKVANDAITADFKTLDFKDIDFNLTKEQQNLIEAREDAISQLKEYENEVAKGARFEQSAIDAITKKLHEQIEAYKQKYNIENAGGKSGKKAPGANVIATATVKYNGLNNTVNNDFANSKILQDQMAKYTVAYQNLIDMQSKFKVGAQLTDEQTLAFKEAQIECNKLAKGINKIITDSQKLSAKGIGTDALLGDDFVDNFEGRQKILREFVEVIPDAEIKGFNKDFTQLNYTVDNGDGTFTEMTASLNAARSAIVATAGEIKEAKTAFGSFVDEVKGKFRTILTYLMASMGWQEVFQQIRRGIEYVREIDSALTELKKVTNETDATYDAFLQTASKTAGALGSTVSDFVNATADFARLGYGVEEASKLAEAASVYKNVGDGINDVAQASESIISTMKAFGIEANDAMSIVNRFNEVGKLIA